MPVPPGPSAKERIASRCVCCGGEDLKASPAVLMPFVAHRAFGWRPVVIDESWGLATIRSGNAYSICNSLYCSDCGFLFLDIRFSDVELSNIYKDYRGDEYTALREFYEPGYAARNVSLMAGVDYLKDVERFLEPHLSFPVAVLDWGGDTGKNTPFKGRASAVDIYDISSKQPVEGARIVSRTEASSRTYGVVICSNVLEHVPYPLDILMGIRESMDEGTLLYIEVPLEAVMREGGPDIHEKKKHWHEHINFFSEESLRRLLEKAGLQLVDLGQLQVSQDEKSGRVFQAACRLGPSPASSPPQIGGLVQPDV